MEVFSVCTARVLDWVSLINEGNGSVQFAIGPRGFGHLAVICLSVNLCLFASW